MSRRDEGRGTRVESQLAATPNRADVGPQPSFAWRRFKRNHLALISTWVLSVLVLMVVAWPVALKVAQWTGPGGARFAQRYHPDRPSDEQFPPPSRRRRFGTDFHGGFSVWPVLFG